MQNCITFKKAQIFYSDVGKGAVVVLLHGFLENSTMWKEVIPKISDKNRVICIDLLGHGRSDCLGYVHSMELMAEVVETVLKKLRIRKCILVGHSMGGYVSLAFADKYPQKIKGICLMNSTSLADNEERKALRSRANKMIQNNFTNMVRMSFTNLFSEVSRKSFKQEIKLALVEALKTPVQGYIACQEGMKIRSKRTNVLVENNFKKLLIIGKKDPVLNFESSLAEVKKTNSEVVFLSEGHMSHIENKNTLISTLKVFFKSC